jgi:glycosyltransferase involved in cell wall biosynthesis
MAQRAQRYADAVVVPTHAVADELSEILTLGDRVRIIGNAVSPSLKPGPDSAARAAALELPARFVLAVGELEKHNGMHDLLWAWADTHAPDVPLVIAGMGTDRLADLEHLAHLNTGRIIPLGVLSETDLAVAYSRAAVVVVPSLAGAADLVALEAMSLGAPVVHSDAPALLELCSDAGVVVARDDVAGYPRRLADAVRSVLDDATLAAELRVRGRDRSRAYSWRDSAEKTWQLHADL